MSLKNPLWSRVLTFCCLTTALVLGSSAAAAQQSAPRIVTGVDTRQMVAIKGSVHPLARQEYDKGAAPGNLPMNRIVLVLKRSDEQEKQLETQLAAMHDPKSSQFHKWLTPQEFGTRYGAAPQDVAKITAWLTSQGFKVNGIANGRQTIEFSGTAASVESAFHTSIRSYTVRGEAHYANATNPSIPAAFSPVVAGVLSLHNFQKQGTAKLLTRAQIVPAADGHKATLKYAPNFTNGGHAVAPGDLWTIYNETPLITSTSQKVDGAGQTIAIVGRSDILLDDYTGFRQNLLPAPYSATVPFTQIQNGPDPGDVSGDDLENSLDVEYSSAMAPAAQIALVVSGSTNTTDGVDLSAEYIIDNNLASVMSTSYGLCEAELGTANQFYASLWEQAAAQGITSMVSTGDNGSAGCDLVGPSGEENVAYVADEGLQVSGLASTPYNVAVGGNEFSDDSTTYWSATNSSSPGPLSSALSYVPEMVWNESCSPLVCGDESADIAGGSGGSSGCFNPVIDANNNISSCTGGYPTPLWQAGVNGIPTTGMRHIPDVSLTAASHDGYMVCFAGSCDSGGVYIVGGTSASSPSFAGIMALVNQKTGSRQGQANYTLYSLAAAEYGSVSSPNAANLTSCSASNGNAVGSSCIFYDVVTGTNAMPCDGGTLDCSSTTPGVYGVLSGYAAGTGFDRASGLGSVNITNLVNHWNDVSLSSTSTALTLASAQSTFGQPLTIAVAVAPASGTGTPTGQVALLTDSTQPGTASAGFVTLTNAAYAGTISSLPGGTYNVYGRYAGDGTYGASTSTTSPIVVAPAISTVGLAITGSDSVTGVQTSAATIQYGDNVSAVATTSGVAGQVAPTGTVTFLSGSATLATEVSDGTGVATYNSNGYAIGTYTWTASYGGNSNYKTAASTAVGFTVIPATTSVRLLSNSSFVIASATATLTAIVLDDSKLLNPTGTVTFYVGGKSVGTSPLQVYTDPSTGTSEGIATFTLPATDLAAGTNSVTSSYNGDGNYVGATSSAVSIGYSAIAVANAITLTATPTAATTKGLVTLTATVVTGGIPSTAGTVTFLDGTTVLARAQVTGGSPAKGHTTGNAVLTLQLAPGIHTLTAIYAGVQAAPVPVTSAASTVTVTGTTPSLVTLAATANSGDPNNYDITGTIIGYGLSAPSAALDLQETTVFGDLGSASINPDSVKETLLGPTYYATKDPAGGSPSQVAVADFNGDGIPDMVTANASFSGGSMSVLLGNGDGTFGPATVYPAGTFVTNVWVADFNNDGILDIAVTSQYRDVQEDFGSTSVYLGNGDGTFQQQIVTNQDGYTVASVVGDFNRDGILDIADLAYYPSQFSVQFGNGDGTFQAPVDYPIAYQDFSQYALATADLNGDGALDLVEANSADANIGIFMNTGTGVFNNTGYITTGKGPEWVITGDVNKDGKQDIIVSNYGDNTIGVFLGKGDGTFSTQATFPVSGYASTVALADMNGDGKQDIVAGYFYPTAGVGVLLGNGDGTFGADLLYPTNQGHGFAVTLADLNGDGTPDVISGDINSGDPAATDIAVLLNVTQATATLTNVAVAGPLHVQQQVIGNYPGDSAYSASSSAGLFLNGSGTAATPQILWTPASIWGAGVPLGTAVLNGVVDGNIAGTITYTAQLSGGAVVAVTPASSLATPGSYLITLTFTPTDTADYAVATAQRTVQIVAPDFAVATDVQALTITAGSSGTVTVSIPLLYGFSGSVALSCLTPLPGGFTCSGSPAAIAPGAASTFTIQTSGLTTTASNVKPQTTLRPWMTGGGITLSLILLLPFGRKRRRKLSALAMVALLAAMGSMQGCGGGASFSEDTLALSSASSRTASGASLSLTATLASKHAKPGGTVTFYNGTTALGSPVALTGNTATLAVTSLPVGLDSLTAVYSGDTNDSGATSPALAQLITGQTTIQIQGTSGSTTHSTSVVVTLK